MACWPWVSRYDYQQVDLNQYPNVLRWYKAIAARPGTVAGYDVPKHVTPIPIPE